jgi:hypothetical protein
MPPLRQSSLHQAEPPVPGHPETERSGREIKGSSSGKIHGEDVLPNGSRTEEGSAIGRDEKNEATLPGLPQQTKSGEQKIEESRPPAIRSALEASEKGLLIGGTFEEQYRLARAYHASGLMPKALNSPEKVLVAMQLCRELGLPTISSLGKIMVVNQVPAIFGDLPLALVLSSGKCTSYHDEFEEKDGQPFAAKFTIQRGSMPSVVRRFTTDDAKRAGLYRNDIWSKYPQRMLQCRARAWALKDAFPDVLAGVCIAEYDLNIAGEENLSRHVEAQVTGSAKLAALAGTPVEPTVVETLTQGELAKESAPVIEHEKSEFEQFDETHVGVIK